MGALLKLILCFYILSLIFSMFVGLIAFLIDVFKWHDKEYKQEIISSKERSVIFGRTGSNTGTGRSDNDNDKSGTGNDYNDVQHDNERSTSNIQPLEF